VLPLADDMQIVQFVQQSDVIQLATNKQATDLAVKTHKHEKPL